MWSVLKFRLEDSWSLACAERAFEAVGDCAERAFQMLARLAERAFEMCARLRDRARQRLRRLRDRVLRLVIGRFQALDHVAAALTERVDHGVAGLRQRLGDVLALFGQCLGDFGGRFGHLGRDRVADRRDILAEVEMHALDGVAHLFGGADEVVVLTVEVVEQAADAQLVVVIGAFQRRHFVLHKRLEFGGARKRALDAVAHGGDFAADGLADGDDGFARHGFRLAEPHCDFGHRLRDIAHLARTVDHLGEGEEENGRQDEDRAECDDGEAEIFGRAQIGQRARGEQADEQHPDQRADTGGDERGARRARLQVLQDLTHRPPVVIGGTARLVADADFVEQIVLRRGRSDATRAGGRIGTHVRFG
jgi:hypothetical protein